MRTRIKYYNFINNVLVTDWFTVRANYIIRGKINLQYNYYYIEEFDETRVLTGHAKDERTCKSNLRSALIDAGVILGNEIRRTTP